jgi:NADPH:quinone reductase-like Zn-dependent oxidoreductase
MASKTRPASVAEQPSHAHATTMKAAVHHRYGPPDVLAVEEIDKPAVGDDEVLLRVHAAGLNYPDHVLMRGVPYISRLYGGLRRPRHGVRGSDVAGTVTEVGAKVTELRPGEEVFGFCYGASVGGAFAEYARAPRDSVVPKPATITFEQAAAVPLAAITALQALRDTAQVQPGHKVLINGASGGVGTFAVQIAKALGATVTGVCSTSNVDLVRSIGADAVIDYTKEDFTRERGRFDVVLDNVANHRLSHCRRALTRKGTLVPNANTPGRWIGGVGRIIQARVMAPLVPQRIRTVHANLNQHDLLALTELIEAGKVIPVIDRTYPLSELPEAIRHLEQGHARGKVVITV